MDVNMQPRREEAKASATKQVMAGMKFAEAHRYAQSIIADPVLKAMYAKHAGDRCSVYSLAVSEYLFTRENGQWIL